MLALAGAARSHDRAGATMANSVWSFMRQSPDRAQAMFAGFYTVTTDTSETVMLSKFCNINRPNPWRRFPDTPVAGFGGTGLWFKGDLLPVVKGESEPSQDTLANKGEVTEHSNGDTNHLSNILVKLRKANTSHKDRRHDL